MPGLPMVREVFVSADVRDAVSPPWPRYRTGARHIEFRETLDSFTQNRKISVGEDPFKKPNHVILARNDPVEDEVWDFRCLREDDGIRCFGCFGGRDLFVAITWEYREHITDFNAEVEECRKEWDGLFAPLTPFSGKTLDEYLTNYVAF